MSWEEGNDSAPLHLRKLFLGGLDYSTTEDSLKRHFSQYGELVDVVVMRFPDTKRSRGFGFVTFDKLEQTEACYEDRPHTIDGTSIETKRATPKEEMQGAKGDGSSRDGGKDSESRRKLFIGGLNYATTDDTLKEYFSQFGTIVDSVVMKFRDTKRSRGFGFVTYSSVEEVDACQNARPHELDGTTVETKRATPKDQSNEHGGSEASKKIFVGGIKDEMADEDLQDYFSQYGKVISVEHMTEKSTGRKRGFGFIEFSDYDAVDKLMLNGPHAIKRKKIDVKRAVSKEEMKMRSMPVHGGSPSPWQPSAFGNGGGGNNWKGGFGNVSAFGNNNFGGFGGGGGGGGSGSGGGFGSGRNQSMNQTPWQGGMSGGASSWEDQGSSWNSGGPGMWGGSGGGGYELGGSGYGRSMGGPMRNSAGPDGRSAPYSVGRGGGYQNRSGRW